MIVILLLEQFLEDKTINLKHLVHIKFDGQFVLDNMNEINKTKILLQ